MVCLELVRELYFGPGTEFNAALRFYRGRFSCSCVVHWVYWRLIKVPCHLSACVSVV
jgi:hypothetical protein